MERHELDPSPWMQQLHLAQGVHLRSPSELVVCSGQPSVDADGRVVGVGDIRLQTTVALDNVRSVLEAGGFRLADLVRLNCYTTDVGGLLANFDVISGALEEAGCHPSNTLLGVTRLARIDMLIELEATAVR